MLRPHSAILDNPDVPIHIVTVKLSNKGRYGIRAVFDIAYHNDGRPTQIRTIAGRQDIPPRFLEQIFQDLKKAGLVTSKRGPKGGYALARRPDEISLGDILRSVEGPIDLAGTPSEDHPSLMITHEALQDLGQRVEDCFDQVSIADLCERGESEGVRRGPPKRYVYSI